VQQKIALKGEQDTLLRKRMSGWNEPMRDYINTLIQAGKIASEQSPQEIARFAQKIGTNRLISEKIVSWDFAPPFDFTAQFLASRAVRRGEHTIILASEKSRSPIWCIYTTTLEPILAKISEKRVAARFARGIPTPAARRLAAAQNSQNFQKHLRGLTWIGYFRHKVDKELPLCHE